MTSGRGYVVAVDDDRARFSARYAARAAALFVGPVLEDLDRSGLLSAGHADHGEHGSLQVTTARWWC